MSDFIRIENLHYTYGADTDHAVVALRGIDLSIAQGEYIAIMGHNGSGKSTLARCLNGLLTPTQGTVYVDGLNTADEQALFDIRRRVSMVMQHPDNQFVSTVVEHEVAFGPENLGLPRVELVERVDQALEQTGLINLRHRDPRTLSAGQKARLAIADMLAMRPEYLVLDESTILLDPLSRESIHELLAQLNARSMGIIHITHQVEEAAAAKRMIVLQQGQVLVDDAPLSAFAQASELGLGIGQPAPMALAERLRQRGLAIELVLTTANLITALQQAEALL